MHWTTGFRSGSTARALGFSSKLIRKRRPSAAGDWAAAAPAHKEAPKAQTQAQISSTSAPGT